MDTKSKAIKTFFILYANPNQKSLSAAVLEKTKESILKRGHKIIVSDLYQMEFNPVCGPKDFKVHLNKDNLQIMDEHKHAYKDNLVDDIKVEINKLEKADYVILIFPLWWGSCPAIMKGWFDRILVNGFAYDDDKSFGTGTLLGKRSAIFSISAGTEKDYSVKGEHQETVKDSIAHIHRGTLAFCGIDVLPIYHLHDCLGGNKDSILKYLNGVDDIIENFGQSELLHKLSKF